VAALEREDEAATLLPEKNADATRFPGLHPLDTPPRQWAQR
jgi:hypothetical protein